MKRSLALAAGTGLAGATLILTAFAGTGQAAPAAPTGRSLQFSTPFALIPPQPDAFSGRRVVVRWAPCITTASGTQTHVIHFRVNPAGVRSRITLAKQGIAKLEAASGLTFKYDGTTSYIPHNATRNGQQVFQALDMERHARAPFVIAWAAQGSGRGSSNLLTSAEAGVGTVSWRSGSTSQLRINDAAVVIRRDAGSILASGFKADGSVGSLLLHELGHAVGLEHSQHGEIMYPIIGQGTPANYAFGDRQGLAKVGRAAGCMTTPRLGAVNSF
jgi:hypothetical protein